MLQMHAFTAFHRGMRFSEICKWEVLKDMSFVQMTYDEYCECVRNYFREAIYISEQEADAYFQSEEVIRILKDDYDANSGSNIGKISPASTSYCLYMLY